MKGGNGEREGEKEGEREEQEQRAGLRLDAAGMLMRAGRGP